MADAPITFAICGTAAIAKNKLIPALNTVPCAKIAGVASRDKSRAEAYCAEHGAGEGLTYDELFARKDIKVVYVALPSGPRNDFIRKCIANGKHVYSEKPHNGTVEEFKALVESCQAAGLQWMDGTMWYHSNRTRAMEKQLKELGDVRRVTSSFSWGSGLVDKAFVEGGNNRTDKTKEPHGMLGDSGHYPISAVMWAFGWQMPLKVQALYWKKNSVDTIITCDACIWFPNGGVGIIDTSIERPHRSEFEVVCEGGVLKIDDLVGGQGRSGNFGAYENPFVGSDSYVFGNQLGKDVVVSVEPCDHVNKLVEALVGCVRAIDEGSAPDPSWGQRSLLTHTVMSAIFESIEKGGAAVAL